MRALRVTITLAALALLPRPALAQPEAVAPDHLAREILANPSYQRELVPKSQQAFPRRVRVRGAGSGGGGAGSVVSLLTWLAISVALGLAILWLAASFRRRQADAPASASAAGTRIEDSPDPTLQAALALAAQERFAEAVHTIFLLAVERLSARRQRAVSSSLTGRELTRSLPASDLERRSFGLLVGAVERNLFGGEGIDRACWERCRQAIEELGP